MIIPKYTFIEAPELTGGAFVLNTQTPYIISKVLKFANNDDFDTFKERTKGPFAVIEGYNIAVQYYDSLEVTNQTIDNEGVITILKEVVTYYHQNRIEPKQSFYKRYLSN